MKLLFDEMLGSLASWFRILGIDSAFADGRSDSQLIVLALKEGRTLLTRDLALSVRCEVHGVRCVLVKAGRIEEQIAQVLRETGLRPAFPSFTRCASCNGVLSEAGRSAVEGKVPQNTLEHNERFWVCGSCGKVFWQGGHWGNISRIYEKAMALI